MSYRQRPTCGSWFYVSNIRVLGRKLRSLCSAEHTFTCWDILPAILIFETGYCYIVQIILNLRYSYFSIPSASIRMCSTRCFLNERKKCSWQKTNKQKNTRKFNKKNIKHAKFPNPELALVTYCCVTLVGPLSSYLSMLPVCMLLHQHPQLYTEFSFVSSYSLIS